MRIRRILTISALGAAGYLAIRAARRYVSPRDPEMARAYGEYMVARHRRVLLFVPAAGETDRMAGGTLRQMMRTGADVHIVAATGSSETLYDSGLPPATHLGYPAGDIGGGRLSEDMGDLWRRIGPTLVLAPDPTHPLPLAHTPVSLALGRAALTIKRSTADESELAFYATRMPNAVVDVRRTGPAERIDLGAGRRGVLGGLGVAIWGRISAGATGFRSGEAFRFLDLPEIGAGRTSTTIIGTPRL